MDQQDKNECIIELAIHLVKFYGQFHGPKIETLTISEENFKKFMLEFVNQYDHNINNLEKQLKAWEMRFPTHEYRKQDDCVSLKL